VQPLPNSFPPDPGLLYFDLDLLPGVRDWDDDRASAVNCAPPPALKPCVFAMLDRRSAFTDWGNPMFEWKGPLELSRDHHPSFFVDKSNSIVFPVSRHPFPEVIGAVIIRDRGKDGPILCDIHPANMFYPCRVQSFR